MSTAVSSTELNRAPGEILDRVIGGERIVITRRGEPVAEIRPIAKPASRALGAMAGSVQYLVDDDDLVAPMHADYEPADLPS